MHIVVIGAGIIGVTTAHALRVQGFDVTVLDRNPGVAQEASFGTAGVVSPSSAAPWAQPGMPEKIFSYLLRSESPVVFRPTVDPAQWRWLLRWFGECRLQRFRINKSRMQRLAYYSRSVMHELRTRHAIDYEQAAGYMQLFRSEIDLRRAQQAIELLKQAQTPHRVLTAAECRQLEPALADGTPLAAGLYLPEDETGNCAYFARRIKDLASDAGVRFRFDTRVTGLARSGDLMTHVRLAHGEIAADAVVLAAGAASDALLHGTRIRVPLYPVKGYSVTANVTRFEYAPTLSVMDESYKVAVTRMGNRLRIAGTAEIGNRKLTLRDEALGTLLKVARDWFPGAASYRQARPWVGARPMLPDGPPLLGSTPIRNLYLNIGHGSNGWAMACGAARVVADIIAGRPPQIDLEGLTLQRYERRSA